MPFNILPLQIFAIPKAESDLSVLASTMVELQKQYVDNVYLQYVTYYYYYYRMYFTS